MQNPKLLLLIGTLALASCGGGEVGSKTSQSSPFTQGKPAFFNANFEEWKKRPVKICDLEDAFGLKNESSFGTRIRAEDQSGIDMSRIMALNNHSAVFSSGEESLVITDYTALRGISNSLSSGTELNAELRRVGTSCTVKVNGKIVYKTSLVESITVGLGWKIKTESKESSFDRGLKSVLKPTENSRAALAKILSLSAAEAGRFIKVSYANPAIIHRETGTDNWNFTGTNPTLDKTVAEVRVTSPVLKLEGLEVNSKNRGNFLFAINYEPNTPGHLELNQYQGVKPYNSMEASRCLRARPYATVSDMFRLCENLEPDIREIVVENGELKELTLERFRQYQPRRDGHGNEWKNLLKLFVYESFLSAADINAQDPEAKSALINSLAKNLNVVADHLDARAELASMEKELFELGFEWAFSQATSSEKELDLLIGELGVFAAPFSESVRTIILDLTRNPEGLRTNKALAFARSVADPDAYAARAQEALELSRSKSHPTFEGDYYNKILQLGLTMDQLQDWIKRLKR